MKMRIKWFPWAGGVESVGARIEPQRSSSRSTYNPAMTPELLTIVGVGGALGGLILRQGLRVDRELGDLREKVHDFNRSVGRLEALVEVVHEELVKRRRRD